MNRHPDRPVRLWLLASLMAYLILPWYAIQDTAWYTVLGQVLGGPYHRARRKVAGSSRAGYWASADCWPAAS